LLPNQPPSSSPPRRGVGVSTTGTGGLGDEQDQQKRGADSKRHPQGDQRAGSAGGICVVPSARRRCLARPRSAAASARNHRARDGWRCLFPECSRSKPWTLTRCREPRASAIQGVVLPQDGGGASAVRDLGGRTALPPRLRRVSSAAAIRGSCGKGLSKLCGRSAESALRRLRRARDSQTGAESLAESGGCPPPSGRPLLVPGKRHGVAASLGEGEGPSSQIRQARRSADPPWAVHPRDTPSQGGWQRRPPAHTVVSPEPAPQGGGGRRPAVTGRCSLCERGHGWGGRFP